MRIPTAIRYQPKATKVWVCTYRSSHLTAINETIAATTNATKTIAQSSFGASAAGWCNALKIFNPLAASMVGIPTRKENSVAATRFKPNIRASKIVVPDRDEECGLPGVVAPQDFLLVDNLEWPAPGDDPKNAIRIQQADGVERQFRRPGRG